MGSDPAKDASAQAAEQPAHEVCITQPYWMDQTEVTNAAFDAFVKAGGYTQQDLWSAEGWRWREYLDIFGPDNINCGTNFNAPQQPRACVSYYEAQAYAKWRGGSLPTEAQWEYAARGTDGRIYPWGNTWNPAGANINTTGIGKTTPVCSYPAGNSWSGACDMAGNVWEWLNDWYSNQYYALLVKNDPPGAPGGMYHVLRGGAWDADTIAARSATRGGSSSNYRPSNFGFRIVTSVSATATPAPTAAGPQLGLSSKRVDSFGVTQVYVPAGCFTMGSDYASAPAAEKPAHEVCITQPYWLDQTEVTNAAFDAFISAGGYTQQGLWSDEGWKWLQSQPIKGPDSTCISTSSAPQQPRICVSYYEAQAYAKWRGGSLPTEAQWEYAARGTDGRIYPWGNTWNPVGANINTTGIGKTTPVCSYPAGNSWSGACDMAGNVWEWVNDWYSDQYYALLVKNDPAGAPGGTYRVLRGGAWDADTIAARSATRGGSLADYHLSSFGFRIVTSVSAAPPSP